MTWPHFWNSDSALLDEIDGIRPTKQLHETYYDNGDRMKFLFKSAKVWSNGKIEYFDAQ